MAQTFQEALHEWRLSAWSKCVTKDDAFDDGWTARDGEVADQKAELADLRGRMEALERALKIALPRLAHTGMCLEFNPTEQWAKKGSVNFNNCTCEISEIKAALAALDAPAGKAEPR